MPDWIRSQIRAAAGRSAGETADLVARLAGPGRGDRTDPVARKWLRLWLPVSATVAAADCSCRSGRCGWCN